MPFPPLSPRFLKRLLSALLLAPIALVLMVASPVTFLMVVVPAFLLSVHEWLGVVRAAAHRKGLLFLAGSIYLPAAFVSFIALRLT